MENYEVKGVSQASEIKKAYEEAVKANSPKYRAISKTNLIYGWDEKLNKHVRAEVGQEWFDNPYYVEPVEEMVEEVKAEETVVEKTTVEEVKEPEIDYKALYEEKCQEVDGLKEDLESAKKYAEHYKQENEELKDGLLAFKSLLNKF